MDIENQKQNRTGAQLDKRDTAAANGYRIMRTAVVWPVYNVEMNC